MQQQEQRALNEYWSRQPEIKEPEFLMQLTKASENGQRVMPIWELAKYRLNKKIPSNLPFEEKKSQLINSEEWNGWVHQHNKHLSAEELTKDNIQNEINTVGTYWGIDIMKRFQKLEWLQIAMNSDICKIYIP